MANQELQLRQAQIARQEEHDRRTEANADREFALKKHSAGFVDATTSDVPTAGTVTQLPAVTQPSMIQGAMAASTAPSSAPVSMLTPGAGEQSSIQRAMAGPPPVVQRTADTSTPAAEPMTMSQPGMPQRIVTPEHYDPAQDHSITRIQYQNDGKKAVAQIAADSRSEIAANRLASYDDAHADANDSRERIAARRDATQRLAIELRAQNGGANGSGRPITATAKEANAFRQAKSFLATYGGDYTAASNALENTPEGKDLAASGVTPRHLHNALGEQLGADVKTVTKDSPRNPQRGVARLKSVRDAVAGAKSDDATTSPAPAAVVAAPAVSADPSAAETAKYQAAVAAIKTNFTGADRESRLQKATDIYNGRVAAAKAPKK